MPLNYDLCRKSRVWNGLRLLAGSPAPLIAPLGASKLDPEAWSRLGRHLSKFTESQLRRILAATGPLRALEQL